MSQFKPIIPISVTRTAIVLDGNPDAHRVSLV